MKYFRLIIDVLLNLVGLPIRFLAVILAILMAICYKITGILTFHESWVAFKNGYMKGIIARKDFIKYGW